MPKSGKPDFGRKRERGHAGVSGGCPNIKAIHNPMPLIPFGEYRPDIANYQTQFAAFLSNALPRADGYGPFPDFSAYSAALAGRCRGFFKAIKSDGSIAIFA